MYHKPSTRRQRPAKTNKGSRQRTCESSTLRLFYLSFISNQNVVTQLYLLLPDPLLQEYKTELADSLVPQINTLVERAEEVIQRDEKKMKSLEERVSRT